MEPWSESVLQREWEVMVIVVSWASGQVATVSPCNVVAPKTVFKNVLYRLAFIFLKLSPTFS